MWGLRSRSSKSVLRRSPESARQELMSAIASGAGRLRKVSAEDTATRKYTPRIGRLID